MWHVVTAGALSVGVVVGITLPLAGELTEVAAGAWTRSITSVASLTSSVDVP